MIDGRAGGASVSSLFQSPLHNVEDPLLFLSLPPHQLSLYRARHPIHTQYTNRLRIGVDPRNDSIERQSEEDVSPLLLPQTRPRLSLNPQIAG